MLVLKVFCSTGHTGHPAVLCSSFVWGTCRSKGSSLLKYPASHLCWCFRKGNFQLTFFLSSFISKFFQADPSWCQALQVWSGRCTLRNGNNRRFPALHYLLAMEIFDWSPTMGFHPWSYNTHSSVKIKFLPCNIHQWASVSSQLRLEYDSSGTGFYLKREYIKRGF